MKRLLLAFVLAIGFPGGLLAHPGHSPADPEYGPKHYLTEADHLTVILGVTAAAAVVIAAGWLVVCWHRRYSVLK